MPRVLHWRRSILGPEPSGRPAAVAAGPPVIALRSTSKMTAVDQPNSRTPFIAVIGASSRQRATGIITVAERRVVHECEVNEVGAGRCDASDRVGQRPQITSDACATISTDTAAIMTATSRSDCREVPFAAAACAVPTTATITDA